MSACLITISGTSGEVSINYKISTTAYNIVTGIGTLYIESTATDVTYTTLFGDAVASSLCLTITSLAYACYRIHWKGIKADSYNFNAVLLGSDILTISDTPFPNTTLNLAQAINSLEDDRVKVTKYKFDSAFPTTIDPLATTYNFILRIIGVDIPILRIRNADNTGYIYLHGEIVSCSITGYTDINVCDPTVIA